MKKTTALLLTFLLLFTMTPLASVQAKPGSVLGKGLKAPASSEKGAAGSSKESDSDRRDSRARDRLRGDEDRTSLKGGSIKDPYGLLPEVEKDPILVTQGKTDSLEPRNDREKGKEEDDTNEQSEHSEDALDYFPDEVKLMFTDTERAAAEAWLREKVKKRNKVTTSKEEKSLKDYKNRGYMRINSQLRRGNVDPDTKTKIKRLDNIVKKIEPLSRGVILYRGTDYFDFSSLNNPILQEVMNNVITGISYKHYMTPGQYESYKNHSDNNSKKEEDFRYTLEDHQKFKENLKQFKDLLEGQDMKEDAYMSTSLDPNVAEEFTNWFLMELHIPQGAKVIALFSRASVIEKKELEMVLPRSTQFTITEVQPMRLLVKAHDGIRYHSKYVIKITAEVKLPIDAKNAK